MGNLNNGANGNLPRLRLAYGTLGGFLAGQNWIPVRNLQSHPELFDFGGDAGEFGCNRAPWLGYTWRLPYGKGNYQHWWALHWRSTISAGIQHEDVPTTLIGLSSATVGVNKQLITAHANIMSNIMWSPVAFTDTGFEYTYGHRQTIFRQSASENVVDSSFRVKF